MKKWRVTVAKEPQQVLQQLKKYLQFKRLVVGSKTFTSGMASVLYQCCASNSLDTMEYLLEKYVVDHDIGQLITLNPNPFRPFPIRAVSDRISVVRTSLVHGAISGSSILVLKSLLKHGLPAISLNTPDCCKKVPIMFAIDKQDLDMVNFLLDHGVALNCKDINGETPLMYLTREPTMAHLIPRFVDAGADISATDDRGYTALHIAVYEGTAEAVEHLLQLDAMKKVMDHSAGIPHPSMLFDCNSKIYFSLDPRKQAIVSSFSKYHNQMTKKQRVDLLLVHATWHLLDSLRYKVSMTFFEHKFAEALVLKEQLAIQTDSSTEEFQSYGEFKMKYLDAGSKDINVAIAQGMLIQERCIGKRSRILFNFLKIVSIWFIMNEQYEKGLTIFKRMSDMLVYMTTAVCNHQSIHSLQQMMVEFVDRIKTVFFTSLSRNAHSQLVSEIRLIKSDLAAAYFNLIFSNIVQALCFCTVHSKQNHSHMIPKKSTSLIILDLFSIFSHILKNPLLFEINVTSILAELADKCPHTIIDINGNPTTILHLALLHTRSQGPELTKAILENGGDCLVDGVGPCGNRPIQIIYNEHLIKLLLDYGAHLDAVNMFGRSAFNSIKPFMPESVVSDSTWGARRLSCLCSLVVAKTIPYLSMDLPSKVKKLILLHDRNAEKLLAEKELMFVTE